MRRTKYFIWFLAFLKFVLPFILQDSYYQLHRDEFLYLDHGQHMAFGYMEVPPLLSFFSWLTRFLPQSDIIVKFWPSLFGALTFVLVAKAIIHLGGQKFAIFLAFLSFTLTAFLRVHYLFQPGFLEVFFWTAVSYAVLRYIQTERLKWLYLLALSLAFGFLSKYSISLFALSIFAGLLLTPQRRIFFQKHFYYAMMLAFVLVLPNLWWQYAHNYPIVTHMRELKETQLQYVSPVRFLIDQIVMNFPCFFVWMAGLFCLLFVRTFTPFKAIGFAYVFLIVLLIVLHGKNYYALAIYPILFAFGAAYLEKLLVDKRYSLRYVAIVLPFILGLPLMPVLLPMAKPETLANYYQKIGIGKTGVLKWEDQKDHELPQDFGDMLGWRELSNKAEHVYYLLSPEQRSQTIIFCGSYGQAGALKYYGNSPEFRKKIISENGSNRLWIPQNLVFKNLLLIDDEMPDK
ncbi:MAG: glycosyltransferase family 39 protein, partial [Ginsengibacter sp.]